jgi:hypothetical protein
MPSEKYSWSAPGERSVNGSTAIDASGTSGPAAASAVSADGPGARSRGGVGLIRSTARKPMAATATTSVAQLSFRPVVEDCRSAAERSASRLIPSGVSS